MKNRKLLYLVLVIALPLFYTMMGANSNGSLIAGFSNSGCSCHGPNLSLTNISISGMPPGGYVAGVTYSLTLTVANNGAAYATAPARAGFDMSCTAGSFTASTGTTLIGNKELVHASPQTMLSGSASWTFDWKAPMNHTANFTNFRIAGNATNGNSGTSGDQPNQETYSFDEATPTVISTAVVSITPSSATITAVINANNANTVATVEYGLSSSYGSTMVMSPNPIMGNTATNASAILSGLASNTLYHYRISAVNAAGTKLTNDSTFTTSGNVSVHDIAKSEYSLSPNPAHDFLNLQFNQNVKNVSIEMYSVSGQKIKSPQTSLNNSDVRIDLSNLVPGTYLIKGFMNNRRFEQTVLVQ